MKKHFWITIASCLSLFLTLFIPSNIHAQAESSHIEKIDGTFIQPWLYMTYDEEQWNNEMQALKEQIIILMERGRYTIPLNWII